MEAPELANTCGCGDKDEKATWEAWVQVREGILAEESAMLMKQFFRRRRLQSSPAPAPQMTQALEEEQQT